MMFQAIVSPGFRVIVRSSGGSFWSRAVCSFCHDLSVGPRSAAAGCVSIHSGCWAVADGNKYSAFEAGVSFSKMRPSCPAFWATTLTDNRTLTAFASSAVRRTLITEPETLSGLAFSGLLSSPVCKLQALAAERVSRTRRSILIWLFRSAQRGSRPVILVMIVLFTKDASKHHGG